MFFCCSVVGHGRSEGERAQIFTFDIYVRDVFQHIDQMSAKFSGMPVFLFGHSMVGSVFLDVCRIIYLQKFVFFQLFSQIVQI